MARSTYFFANLVVNNLMQIINNFIKFQREQYKHFLAGSKHIRPAIQLKTKEENSIDEISYVIIKAE